MDYEECVETSEFCLCLRPVIGLAGVVETAPAAATPTTTTTAATTTTAVSDNTKRKIIFNQFFLC